MSRWCHGWGEGESATTTPLVRPSPVGPQLASRLTIAQVPSWGRAGCRTYVHPSQVKLHAA
jgi:hypothetical protein